MILEANMKNKFLFLLLICAVIVPGLVTAKSENSIQKIKKPKISVVNNIKKIKAVRPRNIVFNGVVKAVNGNEFTVEVAKKANSKLANVVNVQTKTQKVNLKSAKVKKVNKNSVIKVGDRVKIYGIMKDANNVSEASVNVVKSPIKLKKKN
ncbi:MAG TPA: hypothetical protein P5056_02200 [Candidatus Paceibacterota bacterium]|nr:hypothetical protein [Candidatus Paceibacterota bacterium]